MRPERETPIRIPRKRLWMLILAPLSFIFLLYAGINPDFAEWYAVNLYRPVSLALNRISSSVPFMSFGEVLLIGFIVICLFYVVRLVYRLVTRRGKGRVIAAFFLNMLCLVSVMVFLFVSLEGMNYRRRPFVYNEYPLIVEKKYSVDQLEEACLYFAEQATLYRECTQEKSGVALLSGSFADTSVAVSEAYGIISERYETVIGGYSGPKPVFFSVFMSMAQITGVYSPFTAEANVNTEAPEYTIPFTMAHEMAHLQGYMREEEANYLAFLACTATKNQDLLYSAYFNAYIYTSNSLYASDRDAYLRVREKLSEDVLSDLKANNDYWNRFDTFVAQISDSVNDTYLKVNGQSDGTASYGKVTELLLFYYFTTIKEAL